MSCNMDICRTVKLAGHTRQMMMLWPGLSTMTPKHSPRLYSCRIVYTLSTCCIMKYTVNIVIPYSSEIYSIMLLLIILYCKL